MNTRFETSLAYIFTCILCIISSSLRLARCCCPCYWNSNWAKKFRTVCCAFQNHDIYSVAFCPLWRMVRHVARRGKGNIQGEVCCLTILERYCSCLVYHTLSSLQFPTLRVDGITNLLSPSCIRLWQSSILTSSGEGRIL